MEKNKRYRKGGYLEGVASLMIVCFSIFLALFFFSFNLTGNITNSPSLVKDGNMIGMAFLLAGASGLFLYFRKKKMERAV